MFDAFLHEKARGRVEMIEKWGLCGGMAGVGVPPKYRLHRILCLVPLPDNKRKTAKDRAGKTEWPVMKMGKRE